MESNQHSSRVPLWFKVLILITALPLFVWPWLMGQATIAFGDSGENALPWALVMLLPLYVLVSTWISYRIYPGWQAAAWVLQGLQLLVYAALWLLVQGGSGIV